MYASPLASVKKIPWKRLWVPLIRDRDRVLTGHPSLSSKDDQLWSTHFMQVRKT